MNAHQRRTHRRKKNRDFIQWLNDSRKQLNEGTKTALDLLNEAVAMINRKAVQREQP